MTNLREALSAAEHALPGADYRALCAAVTTLETIAAYPSGGLVVRGEHSGDRDEMIHLARGAFGAGRQPWVPTTTPVDPA